MEVPLDYATLRVIWWGLVGVVLIGFALTDGYDMGVATLLPFVGRTDLERRMVINTIGATWEGSQVWFIVAGAGLFAAFPFAYAVSFSGFYLAMFLVLSALILRPVGFKYRSKRPHGAWRAFWDWALFTGGFVPALVFGVAMGNVLAGAPFRLDSNLRTFYEGGFFALFTPFTLLCGLLSVAMLVLHGASWLHLKAEQGVIHDRARRFGLGAGVLSLVLFAVGGLFIAYGDMGFRLVGAVDPFGPSNPVRNLSVSAPGAWLDNYAAYPWMIIAPVLGLAGAAAAVVALWFRAGALAFAGSAASVTGIIASCGLSMFPFILPSTIDARSSLTLWNSSSSASTLFTMLVVTVVFLPIVLVYTAWVYKVLWGRTTTEAIAGSPDFY